MDYLKIYKQLIQKRINQPSKQLYTQMHHIIPRSIDQTKINDEHNLVKLSAREHYIAHALLVKITQKSSNKENYYKMLWAFKLLSQNNFINSHLHEKIKYKISKMKFKIIYNPITKEVRKISKDESIPPDFKIGTGSHTTLNRIGVYNIHTLQQKFIFKEQYDKLNNEVWKIGRTPKRKQLYYPLGRIWIYNKETLEQKYILKQQYKNFDDKIWLKGRSPSCKVHKNTFNPTKGKMWITNEIQQKIIQKTEEIPVGWRRGKKKLKK